MVKVGLVLFIYERFIVKNHFRFYREKIRSVHNLYFSFEKHVLFLSKFSPEIYLSRFINYSGSMFYPCFFFLSFFLACFFFFIFLSVFSLTAINDSQGCRERRGNHYFSCFPLPPAHEYSFGSSRFLPLLLNGSICKNWIYVEIGNDIALYIDIKQVFFDSLIKSTVYLLTFRQN